MRILHRYLTKEILWLTLLGFVFFNFILLVGVIFELTKLIFIESAPVLRVLELIALSLPSFFNMVIPVALLFAIVLTFSRLSADGEVTAMRSSGVNLLWVETPILLVAAGLTILALLFSAYLTPFCNQRYKEIYREILLARPTLQLQERTIMTIDNRHVYALEVNQEQARVEGIILYEFPPGQANALPRVIFATEGSLNGDEIVLEDVRLVELHPNGQVQRLGSFEKQLLYLQPETEEQIQLGRSSWEMTFTEILARIDDPDVSTRQARSLLIDFHGRVAIPLATFILAILAVPLGIKIRRGDKSISLGVSLVAVVGYYVFYVAGSFLARTELLSPLAGMWIPNAAILVAGVWLHTKMVRR